MQTNPEKTFIKHNLSDLNQKDTLLIAIGNSARKDDGLGWAFLEGLKKQNCFTGKSTSCYQLQVEDAEMISKYRTIIFVDATVEHLPSGYALEEIAALNDFTFTTHALTPQAVLFLCKNLYSRVPKAYTLKIQGIHWELKIGLSQTAKKNLEKALKTFKGSL